MNLYAKLAGQNVLWPRVLLCGFQDVPEGTFHEMRSDDQTEYVVDHKNGKHWLSTIANLPLLTRKESDGRGGDPAGRRKKKKKTTTTKTTTKKNAAAK